MELETKGDFAAAAERWAAFWRGENQRPMIASVLPKPGCTPVEKPGYAAFVRDDIDPVVDQLVAWAETHEFVGEAIPYFYLEFAADHFAALLGADLEFHPNEPGGWAVPFIDDLGHAEIAFQSDGRWWRRTVECVEAIRARCDGKLLIASNTLVANLDALAAMRGAQNLLFDMVDQPDAVHRALEQITEAHGRVLDAWAELLDYEHWGSINRHGMYTPGRINLPQCDFSYMISPQMFREFVQPYLRREFQRYDGGEYHLDGPGAVAHLEAVCEIDEVDVVQWVPGTGAPQEQDWDWLYQRIDDLGKGQWLGGIPAYLERVWREYRSPKLYFTLHAESRAEAEDAIASF